MANGILKFPHVNCVVFTGFTTSYTMQRYHVRLTQVTSGGSNMLSPISSMTSAAKLSSTTSRRRCMCRVWIKEWKCWSTDSSRMLSSIFLSKKYGVYLMKGKQQCKKYMMIYNLEIMCTSLAYSSATVKAYKGNIWRLRNNAVTRTAVVLR